MDDLRRPAIAWAGRGSRSCVHAEARARSALPVEPRSNPARAAKSGDV